MKIKKIVIICICGMGLVGLTVIYNMNKTRNNELPSVINSNTQTESCIWIDVKGAVRYPNIYCLPQGSIVEDAISIAGGITTGANMSSVNRVAKIKEEMILTIPYGKEVEVGKISINSASIDELMKLPFIGESKAKGIIEYRSVYGRFTNIQDITKVSGIGNDTYLKIKDFITL